MSTLAGMLLMYFGEEETFWALNILLTDKKVSISRSFAKLNEINRDLFSVITIFVSAFNLCYVFLSFLFITVRNAWIVYFGLSQIN